MVVIGYLISAFVLTLEINAKHIKKLMHKLKCHKCQRLVKKINCSKWKADLHHLWYDLFLNPLKDLLEDEETGMERKIKNEELINNNENGKPNEEIDHEHYFPYLE